MTVTAANVSDQDGDDPPDTMAANHVFTFQTADVFTCGEPATAIHDVQGSGTTTPLNGSAVTIEGVVVGDYQGAGQFGGFYVQEETADADADPQTSEGIFVFSRTQRCRRQRRRRRPRSRHRRRVRSSGSTLTQLSSVNAVAGLLDRRDGRSRTGRAPCRSRASADLERFEGMLRRTSARR